MIGYILISLTSLTLIGVIIILLRLKGAVRNLRIIEPRTKQLYALLEKIDTKIENVERKIHRHYIDSNGESKKHLHMANVSEIERIVKEWESYTPLLGLGPTSAQPLQQIVKVQKLWKHYKNGEDKAGEELAEMGTPGMDFIKRLWHSALSKEQREWLLYNVLRKLGLEIYSISVGTIFDPSIMVKVGVSKKGFNPGQVVKVLADPVIDRSGNCLIKGKVIVEG